MAMTERWKSKTGEERSETAWVKIVCWGRLAETVSNLLSKGDLVFVEGKITTREYTDKEGTRRFVTEVEANNVLKMESSRRSGEEEVEADGAETEE